VTNGNKLPGWVVKESGNKFKGNLDQYLKENRVFRKVIIALSSLESIQKSVRHNALATW